ncbi:MAG: DUF2934 domain-containing protein [Leptolyngbyaceae cyanobacterium bins.302]|nr:DUF2934 domain-containing protein [Leptolyngbyaceae cyanobacterium bins.302]
MPLLKRQKASKKPNSFTDEQIQAKAHAIWEARGGQGGSSNDDWQSAIEALNHERSLLGQVQRSFKKVRQSWQNIWNEENREFSLDVVDLIGNRLA